MRDIGIIFTSSLREFVRTRVLLVTLCLLVASFAPAFTTIRDLGTAERVGDSTRAARSRKEAIDLAAAFPTLVNWIVGTLLGAQCLRTSSRTAPLTLVLAKPIARTRYAWGRSLAVVAVVAGLSLLGVVATVVLAIATGPVPGSSFYGSLATFVLAPVLITCTAVLLGARLRPWAAAGISIALSFVLVQIAEESRQGATVAAYSKLILPAACPSR
ncbi:MAG: hypothetical protein HC882_06585 [Acidobacteria bacterium]|nr:hypothetical protein [Acidobacteriota bacterium]